MKFDIAIIGGGPGGYTAAIYAAKRNVKVCLIEKGELGGTCLNWGCIPTKTLIHTAESYKNLAYLEEFGINVNDVDIDWGRALKNKAKIVNNLTKGISSLLRKNKVEVFKGTAQFVDNNTIRIVNDKGEQEITADNIIIASGSEPIIIPIKGHDLEGVITSKEALELEKIPKSMAIIGGGVIGAEIAFIYNSLGTKISIIEMLPQLLGRQDQDIVRDFTEKFKNQGVQIFVESKVQSIEKTIGGLKVIYEAQEGFLQEVEVENVLMAVGRKAKFDHLKCMNLITNKSGIVVDEYLRTNIPNIYAIGDVNGKMMLAHVASHQGIAAVKNILGDKNIIDYKVIPSCIYTNPEVASVGLTEEEARGKYDDQINVGLFPFQANGKALTLGKNSGFVKIVTDKKWNEIIGVHIIGPQATELIAEAVLGIKLECTAEELSNAVHAHPSLSEAVMEAAAGTMGLAIHN